MLNSEFRLGLEHVEKLLDRRQANTSFYLSVNTGIFAAIGLLLKDSGLTRVWLMGSIDFFCVPVLSRAGFGDLCCASTRFSWIGGTPVSASLRPRCLTPRDW